MKSYKDKPCRACGDIFPQRKSTEVVCSIKCAIELSKKKTDKKKKIADKVEIEVLKLNVKKLSEYEAEAKTAFQKWIRLRDKDEPCISCGTFTADEWAGGHYHQAGIYSGVIFNELNCNKQCNAHCNKYLSGNLIEYRKNLVKKIGLEKVLELEQLANDTRKYKYTKEELIAIKKKYAVK